MNYLISSSIKMNTNNINREILIKTTMWLIWDKKDNVYMLSCKAIWNRFPSGPKITLFKLNKKGEIVLTNSGSIYCKEHFVVHHQRWNLKKHHEIVLVLKKYQCYEPE